MQPHKKTIVTEEGELRDVPNTQREPASYCPHCGTSNRIDSHFCRNCGQLLDEEDLSGPVVHRTPKAKHSVSEQPQQGSNVFSLVTEVMSLLIVGLLCLAAIGLNGGRESWLVIPIMIGWLVTVMARNGVMK